MDDKKENFSIKNWAEDDRPREKLLQKGSAALSDAELIAILIGSGSKNESAVSLSQKILKSADNNLNKLGKFSVKDLCKHKGIGPAKAITIVSALELGRRRKVSDILEKTKITCSKDIYELFYPVLNDINHEEFWIVFLNSALKIIQKEKISSGGTNAVITDVKIIVKKALDNLCSSVVAVHNHPSGDVNPSKSDKLLTEKLKNALSFFDINLADHIIVGENSYFSFADEGVL